MSVRRLLAFGAVAVICSLTFFREYAEAAVRDSSHQTVYAFNCFGVWVVDPEPPTYIVIDTAAAYDSAGNPYQIIAVTGDTMYYNAAVACSFENVRMNLISIPRVEGCLVLPRNVVTIEHFDPSREEYQGPLKVTVREFLQPGDGRSILFFLSFQ